MDFRLLLCSLRLLLSRSAAVIVFEKERVKGFEPSTSTLARGGAGVRSRDAGAAYASRGFALHRALHGLASVGGRRGHSVEFAVRVVVLTRLEFGELIASSDAAALVLHGLCSMWVSKVGSPSVGGLKVDAKA
jgi:hypothetical protein